MCELTFPSGLIYIGIVIVMVIIITMLATVNANQKHELEYLRSRRSSGKKSSEAGPEAEAPPICDIFCNYRDIVIPAMQAEIDSLKVDLRNAEMRCAIMQSTITKLRTGKGEDQNDERS